MIGSKFSATLPLDSSDKIESNNRDDKGSKLVLGERKTTAIFLPHEVVVMKKLLSHAQVAEKDLCPRMVGLGKGITKLEHKAQALANNIQEKVLTLEKERQKMEMEPL